MAKQSSSLKSKRGGGNKRESAPAAVTELAAMAPPKAGKVASKATRVKPSRRDAPGGSAAGGSAAEPQKGQRVSPRKAKAKAAAVAAPVRQRSRKTASAEPVTSLEAKSPSAAAAQVAQGPRHSRGSKAKVKQVARAASRKLPKGDGAPGPAPNVPPPGKVRAAKSRTRPKQPNELRDPGAHDHPAGTPAKRSASRRHGPEGSKAAARRIEAETTASPEEVSNLAEASTTEVDDFERLPEAEPEGAQASPAESAVDSGTELPEDSQGALGNEPQAWAAEGAAEAEGEDTGTYLKGLIEALLFSSDQPLPLKQLARVAQVDRKRAEELIDQLRVEYQQRGLSIEEVSGGLCMRSNARYGAQVRKLLALKPVRLSRAQLETLAIVAYRQPVTRPDVDEIRGVDSGPVLKGLLERELIKMLGKKDEPGRPMLYGTAPAFLELFSLESLKDLPTLREFAELNESSRDYFEARLGEQAPTGPLDFPAADDDEATTQLVGDGPQGSADAELPEEAEPQKAPSDDGRSEGARGPAEDEPAGAEGQPTGDESAEDEPVAEGDEPEDDESDDEDDESDDEDDEDDESDDEDDESDDEPTDDEEDESEVEDEEPIDDEDDESDDEDD